MRDDGVEALERGQRLGEAALSIGLERSRPTPCISGRSIRRRANRQPSPGPEVENATSVARNMLKQHAFSLCASRTAVRAIQIATDVLDGRPFLGGLALHYQRHQGLKRLMVRGHDRHGFARPVGVSP
jgi:hypothetical protein